MMATTMTTGERFAEIARSKARQARRAQERYRRHAAVPIAGCPDCDAPLRQEDGPGESVVSRCTDDGCGHFEVL